MKPNRSPAKDESQIHADRLSRAQSGWLPAAIGLSRRLEQRARRRRWILAARLSAGEAPGSS